MRSIKIFLFLFTLTTSFTGLAQDDATYRVRKVAVADSIKMDSISLNPAYFKVYQNGKQLDSLTYQVDFNSGTLRTSEILNTQDSLTIEYLRYPQFLTKKYFLFDESIIGPDSDNAERLVTLGKSNRKKEFTPFDGLTTTGNISRGVTTGNNQNAVVNSQLDLQITGKLNENVSIRASLQDSNLPTQAGGYSQNLDEFDQIFIELYSEKWNIRAGDVDLQNTESYFAAFTKKVQGISLSGTLDHTDDSATKAFAAGAIVRGIFTTSNILPQEGSQGPYKLVGPNGELFVLIVSGSEKVYVNGIPIRRGEDKDYLIDYNAGEIKFNPTYPIDATMRIMVDYQYTDRNYTRFIGYGGGEYTSENLTIGAYVYSENDSKNQPLQQNLSEDQVTILQQAGDNMVAMTAPSAVEDTFSENKILYRKETFNGVEIFVYTPIEQDDLFNVRFTNVGLGNGNYVLSTANAIARIFEYVPPSSGIPQGDFEPIVQLNAPVALQLAGVHGKYSPSEKTNINFELAGSKKDLNLFSEVDDGNNNGIATHLKMEQQLLKTKDTLKLKAFGTLDYVNKNFSNEERLYNVEFNRYWNLLFTTQGDQQHLTTGLELTDPKLGTARYEFQHLGFSDSFSGTRQVLFGNFKAGKLRSRLHSSYLNSSGDTLNSEFFRIKNRTSYSFKKSWIGATLDVEDNVATFNGTGPVRDSLTNISQRYKDYGAFAGVGDSTKVYTAAYYRYRVTDSLQNNRLQRVNNAHTYGLRSTLLKNKNSQLSLQAQYRDLDNKFKEDENSLNTRIRYAQSLYKNAIRFNTTLESNSGVIAQQDFTYLEVEPGQGFYTWNDYNDNGIQELEEFEISQFQDEANYVRILLPNQTFQKIRQNVFSQTLTLNPQQWVNTEDYRALLSKLYNQTTYSIDRKVKRSGDSFVINPFKDGGDDQLGLNLNFRNVLFFNRGKQRYTTSYTYASTNSNNLISLGLQENSLRSHLLQFTHKVQNQWVFNLKASTGTNGSASENFSNKNYTLSLQEIAPKVSYLASPQTRFDLTYVRGIKKNEMGAMEQLQQNKITADFFHTNADKFSVNAEVSYIKNDFEGSTFSPVAYQILEGLQPGTNFTWQLLFQKKITKYLDLNVSYLGRDTETVRSIHTGSVQLRAYF
jgi:hypothetical protein